MLVVSYSEGPTGKWEYKDGVTAEIKVDPDSFTFYELMDVIREIGYTVQDDNISVYYTPPVPDINNGFIALRNHDDMVVCSTYVEWYQECGDEDGGGDQHGEIGVGVEGGDEDGEVGVGEGGEGVDANKSGEMDDDGSSDSEWLPNDDSSTSTASFSGVEESSDEEEEESIPLEMAMAEDLEMIMAEEMIIAEDRGLIPCTSSGREKDNNTGSGRGARGGKTGTSGGRGTGTRSRGGKGKVSGRGGGAQKTSRGGTMVIGGTGRGGDPAPNKGQVVVGGREEEEGEGEVEALLQFLELLSKRDVNKMVETMEYVNNQLLGKVKHQLLQKPKCQFQGLEVQKLLPQGLVYQTHRDGGDLLG
ncbi:hypothetical protein RHGRI_036346 [Rhododendron griersonianum]|uniref:Transposase n=1 Tax=Rhododendron griersonianum TaxID=479676 RepID=A0AAV6HTA4_9ERIC|nr:hypothetical protein RHGRI_036346 [Rhododendron griersonianum]